MAIHSTRLPRNLPLLLSLAVLSTAMLFGGGSRIELAGPIVVRAVAIFALVALLWNGLGPMRSLPRFAAYFWIAVLALPLLQLIPLPWEVWTRLPGRSLFVEVDQALGQSPWRPISLAPDRSWNALFAVLPALAAFIASYQLETEGQKRLLLSVCGFGVLSALLGIGQTIGGSGSKLYFYDVTNADAAVGLFSNANHHGLFLGICVLIIFALFGLKQARSGRVDLDRTLIVLIAMLLILLADVLTLSRAGVLFAAVAVLIGIVFLDPKRLGMSHRRLWTIAIILIAIASVTVFLLLGNQLFGTDQNVNSVRDDRIGNLPLYFRIVKDYFPNGSGLGSFDPVFRTYETVDTVALTYLNNAHNELAQIGIESGLFGLVLVAAFVIWWARSAIEIWRGTVAGKASAQSTLAKASSVIIGLALLHSLVDYPLRTAAISVVFAICCAILCRGVQAHQQQS